MKEKEGRDRYREFYERQK